MGKVPGANGSTLDDGYLRVHSYVVGPNVGQGEGSVRIASERVRQEATLQRLDERIG
jgi:hypothetical protein